MASDAAKRRAERKARRRQEDDVQLESDRALRARLADADQEIKKHMDDARRSLKRALDVCVRASRGREARNTPEGRKNRGLQGRIGAALQALSASSRRFSGALDDPDLIPEDAKYPGWHRRDER